MCIQSRKTVIVNVPHATLTTFKKTASIISSLKCMNTFWESIYKNCVLFCVQPSLLLEEKVRDCILTSDWKFGKSGNILKYLYWDTIPPKEKKTFPTLHKAHTALVLSIENPAYIVNQPDVCHNLVLRTTQEWPGFDPGLWPITSSILPLLFTLLSPALRWAIHDMKEEETNTIDTLRIHTNGFFKIFSSRSLWIKLKETKD